MLRRTLFGVLVVSCGGITGKPNTGGESHFLEYCSTSCDDGLDCISGVCTRGCLLAEATCGDLAPSASCTDASIEPGAVAVCDVACQDSRACSPLGSDYRCYYAPNTPGGQGGFCRRGEPQSPAGGSCRVAHQDYASGRDDIPARRGCGTCSCNDGTLTCPPIGPETTDCATGAPIFLCPDQSAPSNNPGIVVTDPIDVLGSYISGDILTIDAGHGGGCAPHDYALCYMGSFNPSVPPRAHLRLIHDAHGDTCEAYTMPRLRFDLRPLARAVAGLPTTARELATDFGLYTFGELDCDARASVALDQSIAAGERAAEGLCTSSSDCQLASIDTTCSASCGAVADAAGARDLAAAIASIDAAICGNFEADGCGPRVDPACVLLPPPPIDCVNGRCAFAP